MLHPFPAFAASLLAMTFIASAQSGTSEPPERLGLDISRIEAGQPGTPGAEKPVKRPKGPTEITAHDALFDSRDYLATFNNEVRVTDPEFGLSCDRLTVNMKKPAPQGTAKPAEKNAVKSGAKGDANSGIERAVAEGNVIITQDKRDAAGKIVEQYIGKAKRAIFDNTTGTLKLYGWPQISQTTGGVLTKQVVARQENSVITLDRSGQLKWDGFCGVTLMDAADLNQSPR